ncbi:MULTISPECIES: CU044_5270 family protein [Arthrobacter]|uniref:CU044_5270 family protein n=2 Tax=Arthrobacter TaxID=1663 RepID=A0ABU9KJ42_9MICC|nr:CU044_5270 family protein [Arthrobacter sp. YJM1]MDP5226845.1 CU044_5270 family protein [Arthrobacter sp. YJM1]
MDDLQLLREFRREAGTVSPAALAESREKLVRALGAQTATKVRWRTERNRTIRRRFLLGAVAAGVAVAGVVAVEAFRPAQLTASAEAAAVLNEAAASIGSSDPVLTPGQYLKIEQIDRSQMGLGNTPESQVLVPTMTTNTFYIPQNQDGIWTWERKGAGPTSFPSKEAKEAYDEAERRHPGSTTFNFVERAAGGKFFNGGGQTLINGIPLKDQASIPRDPKALLKLIEERTKGAGKSPDREALVTVVDTLRTGLVPADLRAALYRAVALIPGAEISDRQATLDGQTGVAIGVTLPDGIHRQDIIVDPSTGRMLGEREVLLKDYPEAPAGTVISSISLKTTIVDSAP